MGGRIVDGDYARFLEATIRLADTATTLPRGARFRLTVAILRVCESDREARTALAVPEPHRLEHAAARVGDARAALADARHYVLV